MRALLTVVVLAFLGAIVLRSHRGPATIAFDNAHCKC
jgi:hypothetical protein